MSYGRNPHYIYSDGQNMRFVTDGDTTIPEEAINALLYKLLLANRRAELGERLRAGKVEWLKMWYYPDDIEVYPSEMPTDHPEYIRTTKWMESQEDELMKRLLALPPRNDE